jgi:hypothetical protein
LLKKYFSEKTDIELAFLALTKGHQETAKGSISVMLILFIGIQDIKGIVQPFELGGVTRLI